MSFIERILEDPERFKPLPNGEERTLITGRDDKAKARLFSPAALGDPVVLQENWGNMGKTNMRSM